MELRPGAREARQVLRVRGGERSGVHRKADEDGACGANEDGVHDGAHGVADDEGEDGGEGGDQAALGVAGHRQVHQSSADAGLRAENEEFCGCVGS